MRNIRAGFVSGTGLIRKSQVTVSFDNITFGVSRGKKAGFA